MKSYDAIVIGAGIAGLSIARELANLKQRVLILEREEKGGVTSKAAAGFLDPYSDLKDQTPLFRLGLQALDQYPSFLQEMGARAISQVEYEKLGILYLAIRAEDEELFKERLEWQRKQGLPLEPVSGDKILKMEPAVSKKVRSGVFYPEIPKLNAAKLTELFFESARKSGVEIRTSLQKVSVWSEREKVRGVRVDGEAIESHSVVVAAGSWSGLVTHLGIKINVGAVRGQVLLLRANPSFYPSRILHTIRNAYIVPWPGKRLLVGSTLESDVGFDNRVTAKGRQDILNRASEILEGIRSLAEESSWAGLRPYADKGMPIIGPAPTKGLFLAVGYYRSGILIGPLVGRLLAQGIVTGEFSPLLEPFFPK